MNKLKLITKLTAVHRFAGVNILGKRFNIAEHTAEVVLYSSHLVRKLLDGNVISKETGFDILEYALIHDIPEVATGDLPFPLKSKYPQIKTLLDEIEKDAVKELIPEFPENYDRYVKFIVKLADLLAVAREMDFEVNSNNSEITKEYAIENCNKIINGAFNKVMDGCLTQDIIVQSALFHMLEMMFDFIESPLFYSISCTVTNKLQLGVYVNELPQFRHIIERLEQIG